MKSLFQLFLLAIATVICASPSVAVDCTLSDSAILSLDYTRSYLTASVTLREDVPGPGVLFTIHYPSTNSSDNAFRLTSESGHGLGALTSLDVGAYSNFDLSFTLISIDGSTSGSEEFNAGAVIGPYNNTGGTIYHAVGVTLTGSYPSSCVSSTIVTSASVSGIGFIAYLWPDAGGWSDSGHDVTLLVSPAEGAVQIPEPSSWVLLAIAAVAFLGIGSVHRRS